MATQDEIRIVKRTIINDESSAMPISRLKKKLKGKIDEKIIMEALDALSKENKVYIGSKGITWVYNRNPRLQKEIKESKLRF
jgi:hypothetical protein